MNFAAFDGVMKWLGYFILGDIVWNIFQAIGSLGTESGAGARANLGGLGNLGGLFGGGNRTRPTPPGPTPGRTTPTPTPTPTPGGIVVPPGRLEADVESEMRNQALIDRLNRFETQLADRVVMGNREVIAELEWIVNVLNQILGYFNTTNTSVTQEVLDFSLKALDKIVSISRKIPPIVQRERYNIQYVFDKCEYEKKYEKQLRATQGNAKKDTLEILESALSNKNEEIRKLANNILNVMTSLEAKLGELAELDNREELALANITTNLREEYDKDQEFLKEIENYVKALEKDRPHLAALPNNFRDSIQRILKAVEKLVVYAKRDEELLDIHHQLQNSEDPINADIKKLDENIKSLISLLKGKTKEETIRQQTRSKNPKSGVTTINNIYIEENSKKRKF